MGSYQPRPGLKQFQHAMESLSPIKMMENPNQLICLWGPNEFLLNRGLKLVTMSWQGSENHYDQKDFSSEEDFCSLWTERNLFEDQSLKVIARAESIKSLGKYLKRLSKLTDLNGSLILTIRANTLGKAVENELRRIGSMIIACPKLYQKDTNDLIKMLLSEHEMSFDQDALSLLNDALGDDAVKIENEIRKLSLVFSNDLNRRICAKDIAPFMGLLRSDHAFSLNQFLLGRQFGKAQALISDLLVRGESGLAIVGILARHIRTSLYYTSMRTNGGVKPVSIARLPVSVERDYMRYAATCNPRHLAQALCLCQEADAKLKSSRSLPEDIALYQIISCLCSQES